MQSLVSKAKAVSAVVFAVAFLAIEVVPLNLELIRITLRVLVVVSAILHFVAMKKREPWHFLSWFWSAFLLPVFLFQFLLIGYLGQYVSVEIIATWGLPTFFVLLPSILFGMFIYFNRVMAELH